jgi:hypothetical protein
MAKQHLEAGGNVTPAARGDDEGVLLPADIDAGVVVAAIAAAFGAGIDRRRLAADALVRREDNRLVVGRTAVERLGGGDFEGGTLVLARLIDNQRRRR